MDSEVDGPSSFVLVSTLFYCQCRDYCINFLIHQGMGIVKHVLLAGYNEFFKKIVLTYIFVSLVTVRNYVNISMCSFVCFHHFLSGQIW